MTYIQLSDDSFVLSIKGNLYTVGKRSLNFNKIKKLIHDEKNQDEIIELLKPVHLNDGIYEVFEHVQTRSLIVDHYTNNGKINTMHITDNGPTALKEEHTFVGVYASIEAVQADWPEYML